MGKAKRKAPDRQEVDGLVREYRKTGEIALRDRLISQHLYLVQTVARKFSGLGESYEDLLQEGAMGLINAVDLYDPERGVQFSTYATHLVEGQIRHYLRDKGKLIKQPAWVQELTTKILKATEVLTQELDREPTLAEVAERVGSTQDTVRKMLEAKERSKVASLDSASGDDDEGGPAVDPEKLRSQTAEDAQLPIEDRIFLRESMLRLKSLEQKVVHHFYYLDLNQTEIARKLGISVNYASYLLRGAVAKLKKSFEAQQAAAAAAVATEAPASSWPAGASYSISARPAPADPETKLATESYFVERLSQEVERARRYPQQFSVLLLEPDARDASEEEHLALARLLRTNVRSIDLVAALRGPQFGLLLPHTGREATVLAERIVRAVSTRLRAGEGPMTVSIGVSIFPTNGRTVEALLSAAEEALQEARTQGGNRYCRAQTGGGQ
jgi:RNA polymerase sigma-B factor